MKIALGEFAQESNAFCPVTTNWQDFFLNSVKEDQEIIESYSHTDNALGGMITALREENAEIVPVFAIRAQSGGKVEHDVVTQFLERFLKRLKMEDAWDGVFLSCHGATQTTETGDGVGFILSTIRRAVGEKTIIAISTDLHANITKQIVTAADIVTGYHTYPHIDLYDTGYRAAKLGIRCIHEKEKRPLMAWCSVPMIVPASVYTTNAGKFADLINEAKDKQQTGEFLDFSIYQMQPWLDVNEGGSAVIIIDYDACRAKYWVRYFAQRLYDIRETFKANLRPVSTIIEKARHAPNDHPVILADSADSSNAGASGDSAYVLNELLKAGNSVKAALLINDAVAVKQAMRLGVGAEAKFTLGGTIDKRMTPVTVNARVSSLHDGNFIKEGPASRGLEKHCGPTAVLRIGKIDLVVTTAMTGNGDPQLFRHFGVEPTFYQLVCVKACTSFRAAYQTFASEIYEADTPGAAAVNLLQLPYEHMPKPMYPMQNENWISPEGVIFRHGNKENE